MGLKKILAPLVVVVALFSVSGCSSSPSVAATANGHVITESFVQNSARRMGDLLSSDPAFASFDPVPFVLNSIIMELLLNDTLPTMGVAITDQDRDQYWSAISDPNGVEYSLWTDPDVRESFRGFLDTNLVGQMAQAGVLDSNALTELLVAMPVTVNPRHGAWAAQSLSLTSLTAPGLPAGPLADPVQFPAPFTVPS